MYICPRYHAKGESSENNHNNHVIIMPPIITTGENEKPIDIFLVT